MPETTIPMPNEPKPGQPEVITPANAAHLTQLFFWSKELNAVREIAFAPNAELLAVGWTDGVSLFDTTTFEEVCFLAEEDAGWSVAFSPDGQILASGLLDGT